jgi:ribosomal protein L37AE/L43A
MAEKIIQMEKGEVVVTEPITCKNCGSNAVVKYGSYKGVPRYWCKSCQRKFKGDTDLFHMKTSPEQISSALRMYYDGMSIKDIQGLLKQEHDNSPSKKTIYQSNAFSVRSDLKQPVVVQTEDWDAQFVPDCKPPQENLVKVGWWGERKGRARMSGLSGGSRFSTFA